NRAVVEANPGIAATARGGGFFQQGGDLTIVGGTISENRVTASASEAVGTTDAEASGSGGYQITVGTASITGATITSNVETVNADHGSATTTGALFLQDNGTSIAGSHVVGNSGIATSALGTAGAFGAGVSVFSHHTVLVSGSEFSGNTDVAIGRASAT